MRQWFFTQARPYWWSINKFGTGVKSFHRNDNLDNDKIWYGIIYTVSEKCPNTEFFSDPYFPTLEVNKEIYGVYHRIQSEYRKLRTRKNSVFGYFSRSDKHCDKRVTFNSLKFNCSKSKILKYIIVLHVKMSIGACSLTSSQYLGSNLSAKEFGNISEASSENCFQLITSMSIPEPYNFLYTVALCVIAFYGGISNALLIYGSVRTTTKYNSSLKLFLVLSASDLWTTIIAIPIQIYIVKSGHKVNCLSSSIQVFTAHLTPWNSGLILCVISLVRYITVTTKRLKEILDGKALVLVVFLNFLLALALVFWQTLSYYYKLSISLSVYYFLAGNSALILLTGVIVLNLRLISFLRKTRRASVTANSQYQIKVAKTVLILSLTTFVCYTPAILGWIVSAYYYFYDVENRIIPQTFNPWLQVLIYLNCGIGPSIYIMSSGLAFRVWNSLFKKRTNSTNKVSNQELK